jgi:superfamily II DNA or RNA helicase
MVAFKRRGIWRNQLRNQLIADTAKQYREADQQVLILVDTVDHALHIRKLLPEAQLCYSDGALSSADKRNFFVRNKLLGKDEVMTAQRRSELRHAFERREEMLVIATGVWSVGVSFDSLNVLIRADGGDSETVNIQLPGRVCRIDESTGKTCGILVDFYDGWNPKSRNRSSNRRRAYHKRGWTQLSASGKVWTPRTNRARL